MARLLVVVNSVILLLFGSDMFLVAASEYQRNMRIYASTCLKKTRPIFVQQLEYFMRSRSPRNASSVIYRNFYAKQPI